MNKSYDSLAQIRQDLKVLKLQREISYELLIGNKNDIEEATKPLSIINKFLSPLKKVVLAYILKRVFK